MKTGRKQKPYQTTWGEIIPGLAKQSHDGRWRIVATGFRFSETDERRAVNRFREWERDHAPTGNIITIRRPVAEANGYAPTLRAIDDFTQAVQAGTALQEITIQPNEERPVQVGQRVDEWTLWHHVREMLLTRPEYVARMTGLPEIARYKDFAPAGPSIKLAAILKFYQTANPSKDKSAATRVFSGFIAMTGAKTLADLTNEVIHTYRTAVESDPKYTSAGTKIFMYSKIKAVISFGKKDPTSNATEITTTLDRLKLLWTEQAAPAVDPKPISRENLHRILSVASAEWRAWILFGLNTAMTLGELCPLPRKTVNLEAGALAMIRAKTERKRIPRAATLWPETTTAIRALRPNEKYLFASRNGTRYASATTRAASFHELAKAAGCPEVSFSHLRDGAYTAACQGTTDARLPKILAGHACGMQDHYVLRNPEIVRPACDAVHRHYFPSAATAATSSAA